MIYAYARVSKKAAFSPRRKAAKTLNVRNINAY